MLLALADDDHLPNYDAIALSPGVGWLLFAAVICLAMFFIAHRDAWRKLWLRMEDPRPIAAVRIVFGFCALCNVNGLWELFEYLFMDEGLFPTDIAQHYRARSQFAGFGDGTASTEPWEFFTFDAFVEWLKGPNYSLLLFDSSPKFFWTYLVVFEIAMVMFIVGFQTKWIKWVAWFLYMGIILRNTLFWEATENVYRVFFFYLLLSRCGEGWSVDNWLRCRKLRKQGRLSMPGGPGNGAGAVVEIEGNGGAKSSRFLEPIYRAIPSWPRMFVILNIAVLYCATGTLKNGPVWTSGDAFYYAFNLDHFYRMPPQQLSAYFGTTLFRINTWVVHWWESLFPLVVFGMILRWHRREKIPRLEGPRLWLARIGLGGFVTWFYVLILYSYPVHYRAPARGFRVFGRVYQQAEAITLIQWIVGVSIPIAATLVYLGFRKLRDRQDIPREKRRWLRWLDLDWVCRWILGRRIWLLLGFIFHGHLILTMNVGWFSPALLACYPAFLNGDELGFMTTKFGQFLHKVFKLPMPKHIREGLVIPAADMTLPAQPARPNKRAGRDWNPIRDGYQQSWTVLFTGLSLAMVGVIRRAQTDEDMWARLAKLAQDHAKVSLPDGLAHQVNVVEANWFVLMIAVMALVVMARRMRGLEFNPWFAPVIVLTGWLGSIAAERGDLGMIWVVLAVGVLSFVGCRIKADAPKPIPERDPTTGRLNHPWSHGPIGRTLVTVVVVYHLGAVASTEFPDKDSWSTFHRDVDQTFKHWLQTTQTTQGWGMFAPNPPRSNVFLRVTVTDQDGEIYDLNTDVYACFMPGATEAICDAIYPIPWISYTRQRKINRRIAGSEGGNGSWYQKWHARWVCRQWQLDRGELPRRVELYKVTYPMPSPQEVFLNPYDAKTQYNAKGAHTKIHTTECKGSIEGQMRNVVRVRHGLPEVDEDELRTWNKHRCSNWEAKLIEEAREAGEDVDVLDPRFDVCPGMPKEVRKAAYEQGKVDLLIDEDD
jgi:uncharacterized membrane protein YphA (DoxX/SURF4 family)